jgi:hypothetical protein
MHSDDLEKVIALPRRHVRRLIRRYSRQVLQVDPPRHPDRPIRWFDHPDLALRRLRQLYGREWWR